MQNNIRPARPAADMDTEDDSANSGAKRWKQNGQTMDGQESRPHRQKEEFGPSRVIHVRNIPQEATPADIGSVFNQYGSVFTMVQLQARKQAFIEFVNLESAASCVKAETGSITVLGTRVYPSFSKSQDLDRSGGLSVSNMDPLATRVLLFNILNPAYAVNADIIHQICTPHGAVCKIVVFTKTGLQSLVEFDCVTAAIRTKEALEGAEIYAGCCELKIDFSRTPELNVRFNDEMHRNYTGQQMPDQRRPSFNQPPPPRDNYGPPPGPMGGRMNDRMGPPLRGPPGGPGMRGPPQDRYMGRGPPGAGDMNHGRSVDPRAPAALPTPVLMVYNVPPAVNCDGIFNLFSLYGQVMKAKKLPNKEGAYMVEMLDGMAAGAVLDALQGTTWYGSEVALQPSKHLFMGGNTSTNETRTVVDYTQSEHNRFSRGNKNTKVHEPTKVVHFYNLPPELTLDQLGAIFSDNGAPMPIDQVIFNKGPEKKSSSGLVEFADVDSATQAVISAHHSQILMGERKFTVKMAFSATIAVNSKKQ